MTVCDSDLPYNFYEPRSLVVQQLRAGNSHPGKGVAGILRLKRAFPGVEIIRWLRAPHSLLPHTLPVVPIRILSTDDAP